MEVRFAQIGLHQAAALDANAVEMGPPQVGAIEVALLQQESLRTLPVHQVEIRQLGAGQLQAVAQASLAHIALQRLGGIRGVVGRSGVVPAAEIMIPCLFGAVAAIGHQVSAHCHGVAPPFPESVSA